MEWLRAQHCSLIVHQKSALEGVRAHHSVAIEDTADAVNFTKARLDEDFGKLSVDLTRIQETVGSWGEVTTDEHLEVDCAASLRLLKKS